MKTPKLQVALDYLNMEQALRVLKQVEEHVDLIEAGTSLIKSEGAKTVLPAFSRITRKPLVADLKTADSVGYELEFVRHLGASYATILACSPRENIQEGLDAGQEYVLSVIVDLLGVDNYVKRAVELVRQGVEYLGVHCGVSEKTAGEDVFQKARNISNAVSTMGGRLVVAGGINAENVDNLRGIKNIAIIVAGGGVTSGSQPAKSARKLKERIKEVF